MSGLPVAHFLVDFDSKPPADVIIDAPLLQTPAFSEAYWAERIDEAYARGVEEGGRAMQAEAAIRLDDQKAAMEQGIAAARQAWVLESGPRIAEQIVAAVGDMQDRIADAVDRTLRPFIADAARREALRQLRATLDELIANNPAITFDISGPEDLLDSIRGSLPAAMASASFVINEATDVQIKAGSSLIETRIAAWLNNCEAQVR